MATDRYSATINEIQQYFGISSDCAKYLFHRALRCRKKDDTFLEWSLALQNAIVKADKCLGINWDTIIFGQEEELLAVHGIHLKEMTKSVFRWSEVLDDSNEWKVVTKKKKKMKFTITNDIYV